MFSSIIEMVIKGSKKVLSCPDGAKDLFTILKGCDRQEGSECP